MVNSPVAMPGGAKKTAGSKKLKPASAAPKIRQTVDLAVRVNKAALKLKQCGAAEASAPSASRRSSSAGSAPSAAAAANIMFEERQLGLPRRRSRPHIEGRDCPDLYGAHARDAVLRSAQAGSRSPGAHPRAHLPQPCAVQPASLLLVQRRAHPLASEEEPPDARFETPATVGHPAMPAEGGLAAPPPAVRTDSAESDEVSMLRSQVRSLTELVHGLLSPTAHPPTAWPREWPPSPASNGGASDRASERISRDASSRHSSFRRDAPSAGPPASPADVNEALAQSGTLAPGVGEVVRVMPGMGGDTVWVELRTSPAVGSAREACIGPPCGANAPAPDEPTRTAGGQACWPVEGVESGPLHTLQQRSITAPARAPLHVSAIAEYELD